MTHLSSDSSIELHSKFAAVGKHDTGCGPCTLQDCAGPRRGPKLLSSAGSASSRLRGRQDSGDGCAEIQDLVLFRWVSEVAMSQHHKPHHSLRVAMLPMQWSSFAL
jgi:hypothetical protein